MVFIKWFNKVFVNRCDMLLLNLKIFRVAKIKKERSLKRKAVKRCEVYINTESNGRAKQRSFIQVNVGKMSPTLYINCSCQIDLLNTAAFLWRDDLRFTNAFFFG